MNLDYRSSLSRLATFVADSWSNNLTGLGTDQDKTMAGQFRQGFRLSDLELSALYSGDGIAAKAVNVVPREIFRKGFLVKSKDPGGAASVAAKAKALDVRGVFQEAMIWGRLYGGSLVWVGADDGQDPRNPLNEAAIRDVVFLDTFDRRNANPSQAYTDASHPKYGKTAVYTLTSPDTGRLSFVHETRLIRFGGAHTEPMAKKLWNGWDYSILQAPYDDLRAFRSAHKSGEYMIQDAVQPVIKINGLLSMIAGGKLIDLQTRAMLLEMTRGIARAVFLDADKESFDKVQTSFSGVPDMLDRAANLLSASLEIPVTILMGQAPAGLNATGESDVRIFYDWLASTQDIQVKPKVDRALDLIRISLKIQERVECGFPSLWQETPLEKATREKVEAETAGLWITNEVLAPEEVAVAEFGGSERQRPRIEARTRTLPSGPELTPKNIPGALPGPPAKPSPPAAPGTLPGALPGAPPGLPPKA